MDSLFDLDDFYQVVEIWVEDLRLKTDMFIVFAPWFRDVFDHLLVIIGDNAYILKYEETIYKGSTKTDEQ